VSGKDGLKTLIGRHASSTPTRVGRVFVVVLASAALQLVTQTLLVRSLSKTEVGLISLLLGALPILSTISLVGQGAATVRFLSRSEAGAYDTAAHLRKVLALVLPLGLVLALLGAGYYQLGGGLALVLIALVVSQNIATVLGSAMRAEHRYEIAMVAVRMPAMAAAVALVVLRLSDALTYTSALAVLAAAFLASAVLLSALGFRKLGAGDRRVPGFVMREGVFLLGLDLSFAIMVSLDKLIVGKMMTYADLAVFASVFAVMRGFDFIFYSISHVLMPRVNVVRRLALSRYNLLIGVVATAVSAVYLTIGDDVVRFLYKGEYDAGSVLILPFVLSGIAKLFYSVPSSVIGGRLPRRALKQFLWSNLAAVAAQVVLCVVMIRTMGLVGAALATAIAWFLRLAGGYVIVARHREQLSEPPAAAGVD
jgi:O-antigen/teichoic acid export membrane protein